MPRRVYTFLPGLGWDVWNLLETVGAFVLAVGIGVTALNWWWSMRHGEPAGDDPWGGDTLEWATTSPPPAYNFERIPTVDSTHPLWAASEGSEQVNADLELTHGHQTIGTSVLDAEPAEVLDMPGETHAPLLLTMALTVFFFAVLFDAWSVAVGGGVLVALGVIGWLWPHPAKGHP
jgi:cytochrome c oxidase subunit 1/cytochrome c oxidase subunit I+III